VKKKNRLNHTSPTASEGNGHGPSRAQQPPLGEEPEEGRVGPLERRGASRSEAPRSAGGPTSRADAAEPAAPSRPDPEVAERPTRRTFSAEYRLRILREADACAPGEIGALLRREGLYSSHLGVWRRQRAEGELEALAPKKRGAKPKRSALEVEVERLRRENARLQDQLLKAELIIGAQKKVAQIFEEYSKKTPANENERSGSSS